MTVTVDSTAHTVDATYPLASGYIPAHIVFADLSEPVGGHVTADTTAYTADNTLWPTADGGILPGAADSLDALVIAAEVEVPVTGGGYYPPLRPYRVEGVGYGVLPQIEGEAHGIVIIVGAGAATLPGLIGEAAGTAGVVGHSAAQLVAIRAAAIGTGGQVGNAVAVLKGLSSIASAGVVGTRGSGSGMIAKFNAAGSGRADDDEAAVMTFLLAA